MRTSFVIPLFAAGGVLLASHLPQTRATQADPHTPGHEREVRRIQAHFDSVLFELRGLDIDHLGADRQARRGEVIATLEAYRDRGVFPHNRDFPGEAVPYFIDRPTGTLCAVAHLLESTGRRDIVDRVANMDNNVWVADLAGDVEFETWLEGHGLTLDEAARIQVPYIEDGSDIFAPSDRVSTRTSTLAVGGAVAASAWNALANRNGQQGMASLAGVATGLAAMGVGGYALSTRDTPRSIGVLSVAAGSISALLATRGFMRHRQVARAEKAAREARTVVTPILPVEGQGGAGLSVSIRF